MKSMYWLPFAVASVGLIACQVQAQTPSNPYQVNPPRTGAISGPPGGIPMIPPTPAPNPQPVVIPRPNTSTSINMAYGDNNPYANHTIHTYMPNAVPGGPAYVTSSAVSEASHRSFELSQRIRSTDDEKEREELIVQYKQALSRQFDLDLEGREKQVQEMEQRLAKLKSQLDKRKDQKSKIIDLQIQVTLNEADGLGFSQGGGLGTGPVIGGGSNNPFMFQGLPPVAGGIPVQEFHVSDGAQPPGFGRPNDAQHDNRRSGDDLRSDARRSSERRTEDKRPNDNRPEERKP